MRTTRPPHPRRRSDRRASRAPVSSWIVLLVVPLLTAACATPWGDVTTFPPIGCSVEDADGTARSADVQVDADPVTIEAGDLSFGVGYRSHPDGRVLETTVRRPDGGVVEQVTYVVPGQTSLRNQFGAEREQLTGLHEVDPQGADRLLWSCTVGRGEDEGDGS